MRSRTLAILALAGTCGFPGSVTGETKDVRIATMPAPAGSPCGHQVDADIDVATEKLQLRKNEADVVSWRIKGLCKDPQQVAICPPKDSKHFVRCFSVPEGYELFKAIPIKKKDRVAIYCATEWGPKAQEVKVEIEIGDKAECGKRSERTHMLDIAIVP